MITREQVVREFKKIFPSATEKGNIVTVNINGISMKFDKNASDAINRKTSNFSNSSFGAR